MVQIDTKALNGLRGLAALHVALGHFFVFSKEPTQGIDFIGGAVMPLFFLVSGFVMVVGYGRKRYKINPSERCSCCCLLVDSMNCCYTRLPYQYPNDGSSDTPIVTNPSVVGETFFNPRLFDNSQATAVHFPTQKFFNKRVSRLAPVYYFTNLLAIPLTFYVFALGFFIYTIIMSLFVITSWSLIGPVNGVLWTISTMAFFYCMFPQIIVRLQRMHIAVDFRNLAWQMYWVQGVIFFGLMAMGLFLRIDFIAVYFIWRMFPPNRLPVFVMGCCLGYMRILANHNPAPTGVHNDIPAITSSSTAHPPATSGVGSYLQVNSQSPTAPTVNTPPLSREEQEKVMAQTPFVVSPNNVTSPAWMYASVAVVGLGFHFVSPTVAFLLRVIIEPAIPLLFFDWILNLTRQKDAEVGSGGPNSSSTSNPQALTYVDKFLQSKVMQFMGKISLSFYACHLIVAGYFSMFLYYCNHGERPSKSEDDEENATLFAIPSWAIPVVLILSIVVGWLMTNYVEAPMQKRLLQWLSVTPIDGANVEAVDRAHGAHNNGVGVSFGGTGASGNSGAGYNELQNVESPLSQPDHQVLSSQSEMVTLETTIDSEPVRLSVY